MKENKQKICSMKLLQYREPRGRKSGNWKNRAITMTLKRSQSLQKGKK
jgi:hypothetical protein